MKKYLLGLALIFVGGFGYCAVPISTAYTETGAGWLAVTTTGSVVASNNWFSVAVPANTARIEVYTPQQGWINFGATNNNKEKVLFGLLDYQVFYPPLTTSYTGSMDMNVMLQISTTNVNYIFYAPYIAR